jgi:DNA-binding transcriptional ArsR family regulator
MTDHLSTTDLLTELPVETEAQFKALGHPLRMTILRLLIERQMTNEELAQALGIDSGNSYFHLKRLLAVGFVRLVGTRQNRAITEKLYRAVARSYRAASQVETEHKPAFWDALQTGIELLRTTAQLYPDLFDRYYAAQHVTVSLTPEKAEWLVSALNDLAGEAIRCHSDEPGTVPISLTGFVHALPPGIPYGGAEHDEGK